EETELAIPPRQRCLEQAHESTAGRLGCHRPRPEEALRLDGMALALEIQGHRGREREGSSCSFDGPDGGEHGARLGRVLQSRGNVDDVTRHEALIEARGGGSEYVARVEADPNCQADAVCGLELEVERLESLVDLQGSMD